MVNAVEVKSPEPVECQRHGWLLLPQRPGRSLQSFDLEDETSEDLMKALARYMAQLRSSMLKSQCMENLRIGQASDRYCFFSTTEQNICIVGLLLCAYAPNDRTCSAREYYEIRLKDQLKKLTTEKVLTHNRSEL